MIAFHDNVLYCSCSYLVTFIYFFTLIVHTDRAKLIQLYVNWTLTMLLGANMASVFIMTFPTLHNFVVNPKNKTCVSHHDTT